MKPAVICCCEVGTAMSPMTVEEMSVMMQAMREAWEEAATEHSEIQRLLAFANASTPASKVACQEAKRPRKSGKGTESKRQKKSGKGTCRHGRKTSLDSPMNSDTETPVPTEIPPESDDETLVPTEMPSDDEQASAPAPSPRG